MQRNLKESLEHRRSYYTISNASPISDDEIRDLLETALLHVPSAFNSQSTRLVLLLGEEHKKLWGIVKSTLKKIMPGAAFPKTEKKIDGSFASGYGTVLFFEDRLAVEGLQAAFPAYADNFPVWSQHTSAMHQLTLWMLLENAGFGASLQHYNPLIDEEVKQTWELPERWTLIAQMPFGVPTAEPGEKQFKPLDERLRIIK